MTAGIERFDPPVDIINDPPGHQTKRHEDVKAVKWGQPRSCDAKLDMAVGGEWTVNREFIRVANDDSYGRSLAPETDRSERGDRQ